MTRASSIDPLKPASLLALTTSLLSSPRLARATWSERLRASARSSSIFWNRLIPGPIIAASMSPLAIGPVLALLGVVAAFYVLRGKAKSRKSMYRTLREQRERDLKKARERANAAKAATEKAAIEKEAAEQAAAARAAAAAAAPPAEPSTSATITPPAA